MKRKDLPVRNQSRSSGAPRFATLLLAALLSCICARAFAYDFSAPNSDGVTIYYNYINGGQEAEVTYNDENMMYEVPLLGNTYLGDVTIPETVTINGTTLNVTSIGDEAFCMCFGLTSVTIPSSVTTIGDYAFNSCTDLTEVTIPNSVTSIGHDAFNGCTSLASVTIGNSVTSIGNWAFYYCTGLTSVTIPNSVKNIGSYVFYYCTKLTSVTIPNSVESIGDYAFSRCTSLTEVTLQGTTLPTSCATNAFDNIDLSKATLYCAPVLGTACSETEPWKSKFNTIDASVVTLASGESLSDYISDDNKSTVTKLKIYGEIDSEDMTLMADMAKNSALSVIDMSEATTTNTGLIGNNAFEVCDKLTSISLPDGITSIGARAFFGCSNLASVAIPNSVTNIGDLAFYGTGLTSITIPNFVTSIGDYAFYTTGLTSVTIPNSVTSIGASAFHWCTSLTSVIIGNSVTSIGDNAFSYCSNLTSIEVEDGNTYYHVDGNCLIETASNTLIRGCGLTSITIPDGVTGIGDYAFWGCTNLTSITIPNSVTSIGDGAFYGTDLTSITIPISVKSIGDYAFCYCESLTSVTIPNSVTNIGSSTFDGCINLASVTIPDGVTNIGGGAFCGCTKFTSITIPNSVTSIGDYAFSDCTNLAEVTLQSTTLPTCDGTAFDGVNLPNATLYCKAALLEKCKATEPWSGFGTKTVKSFSVTISDAGIATGCFDDDLNFSNVTGVKAYIASGFNPTTGKVLMTNVTEVPAGTGFLVKGEANTYVIPAAATKYVYVNMLVGTLEETTVAQTEDSYTNYVLGKETDGVVGFYLANNSTVPANKAYLQLPTSAVTTGDTSDAKTSLRLSFDDMNDRDDTTGITHVREQSDSANGKTVIYNLNGQRKQSPTKGLNIVNGKKIFVK